MKGLFSELRHVKVVVVGNAAMGKTTLVKQMTDKFGTMNKFSSAIFKKGERIATDGIEMTSLQLSSGMSNTILHLWDFAGQELFYTTHQFFLSSKAVHLLVFNLTESLETNKLSFWLHSILINAPGSAVILVGTHLDHISQRVRKEKLEEISTQVKRLMAIIDLSAKKKEERLQLLECSWEGSSLPFWPINTLKKESVVNVIRDVEKKMKRCFLNGKRK